MTLEELKQIIQQRVQSMNLEYAKDPGYERCKDFISKYKITCADDFMQVDIFEFTRCYLYILAKPEISMEESISLIDSIEEYFKAIDYDHISNLLSVVFYIAESKQKEEILRCLKEPDDFKSSLLVKKVNQDELETEVNLSQAEKAAHFKKLIKNLRKIQKECDIIRLIEIVTKTTKHQVYDAFSLIEAQHKMIEDQEDIDEAMEQIAQHLTEREKAKLKKHYYKESYNVKEIMNCYYKISSFVNREEQQATKHNKETQREIMGYQTALELLEAAMHQEEITNPRVIVKSVRNDEIKRAFLQAIFTHNMKYYRSLEKRLDELNKNSVNAYLAELKQVGIVMDANQVKMIMHNSISDLKEILSIILKLPLEREEIITILKTTNLDKTIRIKDYIDKGYLLPEFVCDTIKIWDQSSPYLDELDQLFKCIQQMNINPQLFSQSYVVLLDSNKCVRDNLSVLAEYQMLKCIKNTNNLDFIGDSQMIKKLDQMIECGIPMSLVQDLDILNSPNMARLYLLKEMHYDMSDINQVKEVLLSKRFIVPDSSLYEYISDFQIPEGRLLEEIDIEETRQDKWTYNIGGVLVSSYKVKRLQHSGEGLYESIFHGLKISEDDYQNMMKTLGNNIK